MLYPRAYAASFNPNLRIACNRGGAWFRGICGRGRKKNSRRPARVTVWNCSFSTSKFATEICPMARKLYFHKSSNSYVLCQQRTPLVYDLFQPCVAYLRSTMSQKRLNSAMVYTFTKILLTAWTWKLFVESLYPSLTIESPSFLFCNVTLNFIMHCFYCLNKKIYWNRGNVGVKNS